MRLRALCSSCAYRDPVYVLDPECKGQPRVLCDPCFAAEQSGLARRNRTWSASLLMDDLDPDNPVVAQVALVLDDGQLEMAAGY